MTKLDPKLSFSEFSFPPTKTFFSQAWSKVKMKSIVVASTYSSNGFLLVKLCLTNLVASGRSSLQLQKFPPREHHSPNVAPSKSQISISFLIVFLVIYHYAYVLSDALNLLNSFPNSRCYFHIFWFHNCDFISRQESFPAVFSHYTQVLLCFPSSYTLPDISLTGLLA